MEGTEDAGNNPFMRQDARIQPAFSSVSSAFYHLYDKVAHFIRKMADNYNAFVLPAELVKHSASSPSVILTIVGYIAAAAATVLVLVLSPLGLRSLKPRHTAAQILSLRYLIPTI